MCREHAAQLRGHYAEIQKRGADLVFIGTGDLAYARSFVHDLDIPFPVLVDDAAEAARAASIRRAGLLGMFSPASFPGGIRAWKAGHRIGKPGARVDQLGASFVIGPGPTLHYQHYDAHTADHAPMDAIFAALTQ